MLAGIGGLCYTLPKVTHDMDRARHGYYNMQETQQGFLHLAKPANHACQVFNGLHFTTSISRLKCRAKAISWPHEPAVCESCRDDGLRRLHSRAFYAAQALRLSARIQAMPNLVITCDNSRALHQKLTCQLPKPHGKKLRLEPLIAVIHQRRV